MWVDAALTLVGIGLISVGGELVAAGSAGIITTVGVPALLMGMVIAPATIEPRRSFAQVVPAKRGYPDVAAGNVIGTVLYFTLFNLGLIVLITPVAVPPLARTLDWPFLVGAAMLAGFFLFRGRVGRLEGAVLTGLGCLYGFLHVVMR